MFLLCIKEQQEDFIFLVHKNSESISLLCSKLDPSAPLPECGDNMASAFLNEIWAGRMVLQGLSELIAGLKLSRSWSEQSSALFLTMKSCKKLHWRWWLHQWNQNLIKQGPDFQMPAAEKMELLESMLWRLVGKRKESRRTVYDYLHDDLKSHAVLEKVSFPR